MSTIVLAYPKLGYAANSTLTVGTDLDLTTALSLIGEGDARWGTGGPPTLDPSAFVPMTGLTGMTDGQTIAKSAALGGFVAQNPTGSSILAYAENNTGTVQTSFGASGFTDVTSCAITVPASTRPVFLWGYCAVYTTNIGAGSVNPVIALTEVSNGVDTPVTIKAGGATVTVANREEVVLVPMTQLAATTARSRMFKLQFSVPVTNTANWAVDNGSLLSRSVIGAMAG